jgi:hypothetical protein
MITIWVLEQWNGGRRQDDGFKGREIFGRNTQFYCRATLRLVINPVPYASSCHEM